MKSHSSGSEWDFDPWTGWQCGVDHPHSPASTETGPSWPAGRSASVMSTCQGAVQTMPKSLPLSRTRPRSSQVFPLFSGSRPGGHRRISDKWRRRSGNGCRPPAAWSRGDLPRNRGKQLSDHVHEAFHWGSLISMATKVTPETRHALDPDFGGIAHHALPANHPQGITGGRIHPACIRYNLLRSLPLNWSSVGYSHAGIIAYPL